jgi:Lipopolysaccharide-assembly
MNTDQESEKIYPCVSVCIRGLKQFVQSLFCSRRCLDSLASAGVCLYAFRSWPLLLIVCAGCGYHTSARGDLMPKSVHTIAVPAFRNQTTRYQLARMLPEDLTREFIARTHYKIVSDPNVADAVLNGVLVTFAAYSTVTDPTTGRATAAQAIVTLRLTLTERATGKVLFTRPNFEVRDRYEVSIDPAQYFDESETAMQRLSRSVAQATVSAILENF